MPRPTMPTTPADDLELIDDMLVEWNATPRAKAVARYTLAAFARWLDARGTTLVDATQVDCQVWLDQRAGEVKASTCAKQWSELRAFYATAAADTLTDPLQGRRSPMARIRQPRMPRYPITHAATVEEVDAVCATFDRRSGVGLRNVLAVSLMFRSGLRVGELCPLDLYHVDLERRTVDIVQSKTDQPRRVPLHPETMTVLQRYLRRRGDRPGPLLLNVGGRRRSDRMTTTSLQNVVKRAANTAGVAVTPHSLRRGFVVEHLEHGGDAASAMIVGGWSSETMIVRYSADRRAQVGQARFDEVAARQVRSRDGVRSLRAVR